MSWGARTAFEYSTPLPVGDEWDQGFTTSGYNFSLDGKTATRAAGALYGNLRGKAGRISTDGKLYFEITFNHAGNHTDVYGGIGSALMPLNGVMAVFTAVLGNFGPYAAQRGNSQYGSDAGYLGSHGFSTGGGTVRHGYAVDLSARTVVIYINGVSYTTIGYASGQTMYPWAQFETSNTGFTAALATDGSQFFYPIPSGYQAWGR